MLRVLKFVMAFCAVGLLADLASAQTKIIYANYITPKHPTNRVLEKFFADVTKDTNGSVQFEYHFAATLLGGKEIPSGVRDGIADSGYFVGAYVPSEMPVDNYIGNFGLFSEDPLVMSAVNAELVLLRCPQCQDEYKKFNSYFFATYALTPYLLQCKKPVKSLADMKGLKVRGIGPWADLLRAIGATPFNVSSNELYEAVDRGTLDCATGPLNWQKVNSLGEVAKNVVTEPLGSFLGGATFAMRIDKWKSLKPNEQASILRHSADIVSGATFNYIDEDIAVRKEYEPKGTKFYPADKDLHDAIKKFQQDYSDKIAEEGRKRGVKDPQTIAKTVFELKAKWEKLIAARKDWDRDSYSKLLWDEVYSKVKYE